MGEFGNATDRLLGLTGDSERVHDEVEIPRHPEHKGEGVKGQAVGVLEEDQPLELKFSAPLVCDTVSVQQFVNVAVTVRFGHDSVRVVGMNFKRGRVVHKRRDALTLLHERHLRWIHPKVLVLLQQLKGPIVGIARRHNAQRQPFAVPVLFLHGQDVFDVILEVTRSCGEFSGKANLWDQSQQQHQGVSCASGAPCDAEGGQTSEKHSLLYGMYCSRTLMLL